MSRRGRRRIKRRARPSSGGPHCGHSACSQHYIDTGRKVCLHRAGLYFGPERDRKRGENPFARALESEFRQNGGRAVFVVLESFGPYDHNPHDVPLRRGMHEAQFPEFFGSAHEAVSALRSWKHVRRAKVERFDPSGLRGGRVHGDVVWRSWDPEAWQRPAEWSRLMRIGRDRSRASRARRRVRVRLRRRRRY